MKELFGKVISSNILHQGDDDAKLGSVAVPNSDTEYECY